MRSGALSTDPNLLPLFETLRCWSHCRVVGVRGFHAFHLSPPQAPPLVCVPLVKKLVQRIECWSRGSHPQSHVKLPGWPFLSAWTSWGYSEDQNGADDPAESDPESQGTSLPFCLSPSRRDSVLWCPFCAYYAVCQTSKTSVFIEQDGINKGLPCLLCPRKQFYVFIPHSHTKFSIYYF